MDQQPGPAAPEICTRCGACAPGPPLTWMFELDPLRGGRWYCLDCSRQHLRAVEPKLDEQWW